jgi:hypothetical protein
MRQPARPRRSLAFALLGAALAATGVRAAPPPSPAASSCVSCHRNPDYFGAAEIAIVEAMANDVHTQAGLSCEDCHGGNPDPALADDLDAMAVEGERPFRGAPPRAEVPELCGRCHSDPVFMKRFRPDARVDQLQEYWTSHHGERLRQGDTKVATCIDCHGTHGILGPGDGASPVHPTRVAETCARCHADAERMNGYRLADGRPLPTDQFAGWRRSVHATAMLDKGDLSAPTCNDCHGNHGAVPPGLGSLSFVCGQCHGREAELFRASGKNEAFATHDELMVDAGEEGCATCHSAPEPQASLSGVHGFGECSTCHSNHAVMTPRVTMLAPLTDIACALCHEPGDGVEAVVPEPDDRRRNYLQMRDLLLAEAERDGITGAQRFDFLIERAQSLPTHTEVAADGSRRLRPEFARLFGKFRLGKSTVEVPDPASGEVSLQRLRQCGDCHGGEDASGGLAVAHALQQRLQTLTALIARAERIVLSARRGGVPVGDAAAQIDAAVDAQIQLQVLVHTFSAEGAFAAKHAEGLEHAGAALTAGQQAIEELRFRRRGLGVALGVIVLVLVGLGLKIRQHPPD